MSETREGSPGITPETGGDPARYDPPKIVWREPYLPVTAAVSCAKQPGNPPCNPGPVST
jgi:hypothetical protein